MAKPLVVVSLLGTTLDAGQGQKRWKRWRPTVALCRHPELPVRRLELLRDPRYSELGKTVVADIAETAPKTEVKVVDFPIRDPWDFQEVYGALHDFARAYPWGEKEDYLVHITTGSHVAQICLFLLTETRHFPARLLQTGPAGFTIIDLDLSKYDRLASRFDRERRQDLSSLKGGI